MTKTKIEWSDETWNPVVGCTKVSPGCDHCYAERITERFHGKGSFAEVKLHPQRLDAPLRWRKPRRVFVNSMSDLFHQDVPDKFIAWVFAVMAMAPLHTFQVLTKRHGRMRTLLKSSDFWKESGDFGRRIATQVAFKQYRTSGPMKLTPDSSATGYWEAANPLPNVWLGVSVEDQQRADLRIPVLLETPAAVRFLSCEPLLGPVDLSPALLSDSVGRRERRLHGLDGRPVSEGQGIDWVIGGGESGSGARPMHPDWARSLRDQCTAAGVPFFFKQWGEYRGVAGSRYDHATKCWVDDGVEPQRVGKKAAGRELDGRTWDEYPREQVLT